MTRYSNVQFLHITRDSAHSILEYTQNPNCSETELIRTLAKYATVELSRNPEQLLVRNPHILKHIFHMSSQFAVTYFHLELDVTNCDFHFSSSSNIAICDLEDSIGCRIFCDSLNSMLSWRKFCDNWSQLRNLSGNAIAAK